MAIFAAFQKTGGILIIFNGSTGGRAEIGAVTNFGAVFHAVAAILATCSDKAFAITIAGDVAGGRAIAGGTGTGTVTEVAAITKFAFFCINFAIAAKRAANCFGDCSAFVAVFVIPTWCGAHPLIVTAEFHAVFAVIAAEIAFGANFGNTLIIFT